MKNPRIEKKVDWGIKQALKNKEFEKIAESFEFQDVKEEEVRHWYDMGRYRGHTVVSDDKHVIVVESTVKIVVYDRESLKVLHVLLINNGNRGYCTMNENYLAVTKVKYPYQVTYLWDRKNDYSEISFKPCGNYDDCCDVNSFKTPPPFFSSDGLFYQIEMIEYELPTDIVNYTEAIESGITPTELDSILFEKHKVTFIPLKIVFKSWNIEEERSVTGLTKELVVTCKIYGAPKVRIISVEGDFLIWKSWTVYRDGHVSSHNHPLECKGDCAESSFGHGKSLAFLSRQNGDQTLWERNFSSNTSHHFREISAKFINNNYCCVNAVPNNFEIYDLCEGTLKWKFVSDCSVGDIEQLSGDILFLNRYFMIEFIDLNTGNVLCQLSRKENEDEELIGFGLKGYIYEKGTLTIYSENRRKIVSFRMCI